MSPTSRAIAAIIQVRRDGQSEDRVVAVASPRSRVFGFFRFLRGSMCCEAVCAVNLRLHCNHKAAYPLRRRRIFIMRSSRISKQRVTSRAIIRNIYRHVCSRDSIHVQPDLSWTIQPVLCVRGSGRNQLRAPCCTALAHNSPRAAFHAAMHIYNATRVGVQR